MIALLQGLKAEFPRAKLLAAWYPRQQHFVIYLGEQQETDSDSLASLAAHYFSGLEPTQTRHVVLSGPERFDAFIQLPGGIVLLISHDLSLSPKRVVATVNDFVLTQGIEVPEAPLEPELIERSALLTPQAHTNLRETAAARASVDDAADRLAERAFDRQQDAMAAAQRSQAQLLSDITPIRRYVQDVTVYYQPKDFVGGDFYYFQPTDDGFCFALADYTGHGVQGALGAMMCVSLLNHIVSARLTITPTQVMLRLHQGLTRMVGNSNDKNNQQPGLEILFGQFVTSSRRVQLCSAGIDTLLIRNGHLVELPRLRHPVGSAAFSVSALSTLEYELNDTDVLVAYTDGVKDQLEAQSRRRIGRKAVHTLVQAHSNGTFGQLSGALRERLTAWRGANEQTDDTTLIGLKF